MGGTHTVGKCDGAWGARTWCDGAWGARTRWEHVTVHGGHVMAAWVADEKGRGGMKVVMCYAIHIYVSIRDMKYDVCVCDEACAM